MRAFCCLGFTAGILVACGGADSTTGDGGDGSVNNNDGAGMDGSGNPDGAMDGSGNDSGGGDGATDGSGGDASLDGNGDGGMCAGMWVQCSACLTMSCASVLTACNANMTCKNGFAALAACESMCGNNCIGTFENTGMLAQNVSDCGQTNCNVCGW